MANDYDFESMSFNATSFIFGPNRYHCFLDVASKPLIGIQRQYNWLLALRHQLFAPCTMLYALYLEKVEEFPASTGSAAPVVGVRFEAKNTTALPTCSASTFVFKRLRSQ